MTNQNIRIYLFGIVIVIYSKINSLFRIVTRQPKPGVVELWNEEVDYYYIKINQNPNAIITTLDQLTKNIEISYQNQPISITDDQFLTNENNLIIKVPSSYELAKLVVVINGNQKHQIFRQKSLIKPRYYIFEDAHERANDNAEHLYRIVKNNKNVFFGLNKDSKDYARLQAEGFQIIQPGSFKYMCIYLQSKWIVSSHIDWRIENFKGLRYPYGQSPAKFFFLQHGITVDDLSGWLSKKRMNKIAIATKFEDQFMTENYNLFPEQKVKSALVRYGQLIPQSGKQIMYCPTWRLHLDGVSEIEFKASEYYAEIQSIINNQEIIKIAESNGLKFKLVLHPRCSNYISYIPCDNSRIEITTAEKINYTDEINKSTLLITDYSSVYGDFAWNKKPIIFYQSDEQHFFANHSYGKNLDYTTLKFANYATTIEQFETEVNKIAENNFEMSDIQKQAASDYFYDYDNELILQHLGLKGE